MLLPTLPSMLNHIRMGKVAGWRPRGHHERVRESCMMNFVYHKRGERDLPYRLSAGKKKDRTSFSPDVASPMDGVLPTSSVHTKKAPTRAVCGRAGMITSEATRILDANNLVGADDNKYNQHVYGDKYKCQFMCCHFHVHRQPSHVLSLHRGRGRRPVHRGRHAGKKPLWPPG